MSEPGARPSEPGRLSATLQSAFAHLSLRRIITSNRFIPEVDGFRFLAILIVILSHVYVQCGVASLNAAFRWAPVARALVDGQRGVFLFFAISGFILALPFARQHLQGAKRVELRSYFRRRLTRLEPPYLIALSVRSVLLLVTKHLSVAYVLVHLLASVFYVHNVAFNAYSVINPPAWSLEIEVQFYLLAPILTLLFLIRGRWLRRAVLLLLVLGSGVLAHLYIHDHTIVSLTLLNYLNYFLIGFLLCDLYLVNDLPRLPGLVWDLAGVLALLWIVYSASPWYSVALPFFTLLLYLAGFYGKLVRGFFRLGPVSIMGGMCYSLYLTHTAVLTAITGPVQALARSALLGAAVVVLVFAFALLASLGLGTVFFVLIERPCMDPAWPGKLLGRLRGQQ